MEMAIAHKTDYLAMADSLGPVEQLIFTQEPGAPAGITNQELPCNQFMRQYKILVEKAIQFLREGSPARQESDPHRRVYQNHLRSLTFRRRLFPSPGHVSRFWLAAAQRPSALVSRMAYQ